MISKEQFKEYFNRDIFPKLKTENLKLILCKVGMFFFTLLSFSFLIWSGVIVLSGGSVPENFLFVPIVAIVSLALVLGCLIYYYDLIRGIQPKILKPILLKVFQDNKFLYEEADHVSKDNVIKSKFVSESIFELSGEDYLQITMPIDDTEITIHVSDIFVNVHKPALWGGDKLETIDSGVFGVVDYGKEIKAEILGNFNLPGFKELELESMNFNEQFKCYTKDQIEARKILTPRIMARLLKLQGEVDKKIRFHFSGTCLYFLVQKNLFKYRLKGKVDFSEAEQIYDQLYIIYEVAKEIPANKKIFK